MARSGTVVAKTTKRATAARPTIAGLQRELREALDSAERGWAHARSAADDVIRLGNQRDASWAALGRLWEATGGEQGDRKAETREELLDWAVDDAITLIERGKAATRDAREWREKYEKAAETLADAECNMRLNQDEYERVCAIERQHRCERAACWGCRVTRWLRGLRG